MDLILKYLLHQCDDKLFNRSHEKYSFDVKRDMTILQFHDVDMLPEDGGDYSYPNEHPVHIFTNLSQWDYRLRDIEYFGGCVLFTKEQFENVNATTMIIGIGVWKMTIYFGDVF